MSFFFYLKIMKLATACSISCLFMCSTMELTNNKCLFSVRDMLIFCSLVSIFTGDTSLLCFNATFTTSQCNVKWTMYTMVVSSLLGSTLDVFGHIRT